MLMSISSLEYRVSSRPREGRPPRLTSPSTLVSVVSLEVVSLRYVDGKTLIGMGKRASKSRLPDVWAPQLSSPLRQSRVKTVFGGKGVWGRSLAACWELKTNNARWADEDFWVGRMRMVCMKREEGKEEGQSTTRSDLFTQGRPSGVGLGSPIDAHQHTR